MAKSRHFILDIIIRRNCVKSTEEDLEARLNHIVQLNASYPTDCMFCWRSYQSKNSKNLLPVHFKTRCPYSFLGHIQNVYCVICGELHNIKLYSKWTASWKKRYEKIFVASNIIGVIPKEGLAALDWCQPSRCFESSLLLRWQYQKTCFCMLSDKKKKHFGY